MAVAVPVRLLYCSNLIKQLDFQNKQYLFFDNKRTARHLLPQLKNKVNIFTPGRSLAKFSFNPFITPAGMEPSVYINQVIDVLAGSYSLGDGAKSILQKAVMACYTKDNTAPAINDIINEVNNIESKERVRSWKITALRALESINFSNLAISSSSQEELTQRLIHENSIMELDGLSENDRKFLIPVLYQWIYQYQLASNTKEKLAISVFFDEAHLYFGQNSTFMERLLRLTRELGIASILADQTPSLISKVVLANCYTNVFLNLVNSSDLNKAASVCLMDKEESKLFSRLPIGHAIVKLQDKWHKPFLYQDIQSRY